METYKNIQITNCDKIGINRCKAMINTLKQDNYRLYEVILSIYYNGLKNEFYYTTCLSEDNNQALTLTIK